MLTLLRTTCPWTCRTRRAKTHQTSTGSQAVRMAVKGIAQAPRAPLPSSIAQVRSFRPQPTQPRPSPTAFAPTPSSAHPPRSISVGYNVPVTPAADTRRRVRLHVNPLQAFYLQEVAIPDWNTTFASPVNPIHFDIGFGKGLYMFRLARDHRDWNFLGIEVRLPLVQAALAMQQSAGLKNLHFMWGSANVNFARIAASLPQGKLQRVSVLYPDPWFKKRHAKRRMLTPRLVGEIADALPERGQMLIETDVQPLAEDMWPLMKGDYWREVSDPSASFAQLDLETERQASVKRYGRPSFRKIYERTDKKMISSSVGSALSATPIQKGS